MTEPMVIAWSSCSTRQAETSASCSIQKTCSADDVGYSGTDWAPIGPQREVEQGPLVAGARHDADPVAEPDALREQALGQGEDLVPELCRAVTFCQLPSSSLRASATRPGSDSA